MEPCGTPKEILIPSDKQAHKVCVGQNELVLSLLEEFSLNLTLK
jgi:hypothetical protein